MHIVIEFPRTCGQVIDEDDRGAQRHSSLGSEGIFSVNEHDVPPRVGHNNNNMTERTRARAFSKLSRIYLECYLRLQSLKNESLGPQCFPEVFGGRCWLVKAPPIYDMSTSVVTNISQLLESLISRNDQACDAPDFVFQDLSRLTI